MQAHLFRSLERSSHFFLSHSSRTRSLIKEFNILQPVPVAELIDQRHVSLQRLTRIFDGRCYPQEEHEVSRVTRRNVKLAMGVRVHSLHRDKPEKFRFSQCNERHNNIEICYIGDEEVTDYLHERLTCNPAQMPMRGLWRWVWCDRDRFGGNANVMPTTTTLFAYRLPRPFEETRKKAHDCENNDYQTDQ